MNDNRPWGEASALVARAATPVLERVLRLMPVVVVTGARQTGKSTLVRSAPSLSSHDYLSLDELAIRDQALRDPESLVIRSPELVLDEVQRAPDLLLAVKRVVDEEGQRRKGRFVLTGSANLLLMERISESLAGRAFYLTLWPLTRRERLGLGETGLWSALLDAPIEEWPDRVRAADTPREDWRDASLVGGYPTPALALSTTEGRAAWFDGYVATYLERDLQLLSDVAGLGDYRRLMLAAALRVGTVLNQAELARDVAVPRPTAHRWLNLLEASFQILRIPAYSVNRTKRLIKSPKLYWSDVGLARHLAGGEPSGAHLENLILCDLMAWRDLVTPRPNILYWRTVNGEEVDFVIEHGRTLVPVEVKATPRPSYRDARHLLTFLAEYGDAVRGALLLHDGDEVFWLARGVLAAPWWTIV
ncbi:MAG: AAA family ATPase [Gemmatimonas sp.]|nr:AAA family ATPase [Gemmatimonas sp.]